MPDAELQSFATSVSSADTPASTPKITDQVITTARTIVTSVVARATHNNAVVTAVIVDEHRDKITFVKCDNS
ncbi:MAG: hypothetical protein ACON5H_12070 [Akkermansiaceae bacterium]